MIRSKHSVARMLPALGASALLLIVSFGSDPANAQNAGRGGAASTARQMNRPVTTQRPTMPRSQPSIPQQAQDRAPQQARDRAPPFGGSQPDSAEKGLEKAAEKAADRAKEVAPPLGGTLPDAAKDGLEKAAEKASDKAKEVARPLGGDPANAGGEKPTE